MSPDTLLDLLRSSPEPLGLSELSAHLPNASRRTLQRELRALVARGLVERRGAARATRYTAVTSAATSASRSPLATANAEASPDRRRRAESPEEHFAGIPLAPDAAEVLAYVLRPIVARAPVGYQREWIEEYTPGQTYLLPASDRDRLQILGATGQGGLPAGTFGREVMQRLLIDLSWASSHLEGNTYTRLDTRELIEHGRHVEGHDAIETQMILNHKAAIELLVDQAGSLELSPFLVKSIHGLLSENLLPDRADEGRVRQRAVLIGGSVYRPLDVPSQLEESLELMLNRAATITDPFEQSFFLLAQIPYLQPFADVNKRTGRILANLPLIASNLCPLTFVDVPTDAYALAMLGVYELTRTELLRDLYLWAYERSSREYLTLQRRITPPDPLRLAYRDEVREVVREVVRSPERDPIDVIERWLERAPPREHRTALRELLLDELRRLHEGTLMRYGLRVSEFERWKARER